MEVVLSIRIPDHWAREVSELLGSPVRVLQAVPDGQEGGRGLVEIHGDDEMTRSIVDAIRDHPSVCRVEFVPLPEGGVLGEVVTAKCAACRALTGVDCFLVSATTREDGSLDWRLITGGEGSLRELVERLVAEGCEVDIRKARAVDRHRRLTDRQEELLKLAIREGYYDQPKRTTIKRLAKMAGVAPSTYQEVLQRAERKVLATTFEEGD